VARALIVACGCRGQALARALVSAGHSARGTTRREDRLADIEAAGAEAALADPGTLATLFPLLEGVSVICWLLAGATGEPDEIAALHGPRLRSLLGTLVDAPVRGFVYESSGTVAPAVTATGADIVRRAQSVHRMPIELIEAPAGDHRRWVAAGRGAVEAVLSKPP
jgi:nucleoside-diphosphate-sugar epimerase